MDIAAFINMYEIKWIILLVTISLSVMDFYIRRIPNNINVVTFGIMILAALLIKERDTLDIFKDITLVSGVSFLLFYMGVLGGGDCKYLIALSPILSSEVLFKVTFLAMILFAGSYGIKKSIEFIVKKQPVRSVKFQLHKMPFLWSLIPGVYIFVVCA